MAFNLGVAKERKKMVHTQRNLIQSQRKTDVTCREADVTGNHYVKQNTRLRKTDTTCLMCGLEMEMCFHGCACVHACACVCVTKVIKGSMRGEVRC